MHSALTSRAARRVHQAAAHQRHQARTQYFVGLVITARHHDPCTDPGDAKRCPRYRQRFGLVGGLGLHQSNGATTVGQDLALDRHRANS